jgi:hypothetical protein
LNASGEGTFLTAFGALTTKLPPCMRYIRIDSPQLVHIKDGQRLAMEQQVQRVVRQSGGPFFLLTHTAPAALALSTTFLSRYNLALDEEEPSKRITGWFAELGYWRLKRRAGASPAAVTAAAADPRQAAVMR